jgi:NDP-sugar pyrophosphorylase family protein
MYEGIMQDLSDITTVILAGGLGKRLRSVVGDKPKVLAQVRSRPFLSYLLDQIAAAGLDYVVLCIGYLGEQVQTTFGESSNGLHLVYSKELSPLGTAGALRLAMPLFRSDPLLVMNGDSYCHVDLKAFWTWHNTKRAEATILLTQVSDTGRYGRVQIRDNDGLVLGIEEKSLKNDPGWINAGIYLLSHRLLLSIPNNGVVSLERDMFPSWIDQGLYGYRTTGRFLDIGVPTAYKAAEQFFTEAEQP